MEEERSISSEKSLEPEPEENEEKKDDVSSASGDVDVDEAPPSAPSPTPLPQEDVERSDKGKEIAPDQLPPEKKKKKKRTKHRKPKKKGESSDRQSDFFESGMSHEGWLYKKIGLNTWDRRWFTLSTEMKIRYFENDKKNKELGQIDVPAISKLSKLVINYDKKDNPGFSFSHSLRSWKLFSVNEEERDVWFNKIEQVLKNMDQIQGGGIVFRLMQGVKICLKSEPNRKLGIEFADYNRTVTHEVTYPNNVKLSIQEICPSIFGDIREMNKISQISLLKEWDIPQDKLTASESSGKSGSIFILSNEKSFMIKSIEKREEKLLLRMIHDYHQHLVTNPQSLLMKVLAFYSIKNTISRESYIMFNNLLKINVSIDEKYDLKGSTKDREASKVERAKAVPCLLDNDFIAAQRKLHFGPVKAEFMKQLVADSSLLCRFDSMDYSFLVGIHKVKPEDKEFVQSQKSSIFYNSPLGDKVCTIISSDKTEIYFVGVIDIFTFYDAEKRVANAAKSVKYSEDSLSTVNAQKYSSRFCTFVDSIID